MVCRENPLAVKGIRAAYQPCGNRKRIRGAGLTTPDKPVARRPSTVSVQARIEQKRAIKRTNVGLASLRTDRRYCACCSLFPLPPRATVPPFPPFVHLLYLFLSLFCTPGLSACPRHEPATLEIAPLEVPQKRHGREIQWISTPRR